MTNKTSKRLIREFDQNFTESIADFPGQVVKTLKNDVLKDSVTTAWEQILGSSRKMSKADIQEPVKEGKAMSGDLVEGQAVDIFKKEQWKELVEPGINYAREVIHSEKRIVNEQNRELATKIEEIVIELKKLSKSSKELQITFKNVTVEQLPVNPGKYHLNFFEWMLVTIQNARMRIEDSAAWAGVVTGKKNKKDYWNLAKQHGTSFSLSGERTAATQTG